MNTRINELDLDMPLFISRGNGKSRLSFVYCLDYLYKKGTLTLEEYYNFVYALYNEVGYGE